MPMLSPRTVYAPGRKPPKAEIIQLLEAMRDGDVYGVAKATKAELLLVVPEVGLSPVGYVFDDPVEANNGIVLGHYNKISTCFVLDRPATFRINAFWVVAGTFKANSFASLTRIRSV